MSKQGVDRTRRRLLMMTSGIGAVGAAFVAVPFVKSMLPSARARAAGAPVEVDISKIEYGMKITIEWRGKPVWILRRTPEMLATLEKVEPKMADPESKESDQPEYVDPRNRASNPEYLVVLGICTHLGCSPKDRLQPGSVSGLGADWLGGFFCPCHGSTFDLAGRVFKNVPAPTNLPVPPYRYLSDSRIIVGEDEKGAA
ncbi:MAG: ubiquinol-cytochrome c reductase iron-sulfur subunit [Acidiferrobacterales bacterium]